MRVESLTVEVAGGRRILGPISLDLRSGEWAVLVGPNGAGKTTLCHVLAHSLRPSTGSVLNGATVGLLAQAPPRPMGLTALEYALLGVHGWAGPGDLVVARAEEALVRCGVAPNQRTETLSGGEFRKAGIARLLSLSPEVMILDEPTAGLDPQARIEIFELLDELRGERALLTVMHDLSTAAQFGERMLILDEGTVVADGAPDSVIASPELVATFGDSVRLVEVDGRLIPVMVR